MNTDPYSAMSEENRRAATLNATGAIKLARLTLLEHLPVIVPLMFDIANTDAETRRNFESAFNFIVGDPKTGKQTAEFWAEEMRSALASRKEATR